MYCTVEEVMSMIKEDMYNAILGDEYVDDVEERNKKIAELTEGAMTDADAEIDGYLMKRYNLPFKKTPGILNKFGKDIAAYNLVSRFGIDENDRDKTFLTRYNAAIKFLTLVAEGKVEIGDYTPEKQAETGFHLESSRRLFTRDSMRGW